MTIHCIGMTENYLEFKIMFKVDFLVQFNAYLISSHFRYLFSVLNFRRLKLVFRNSKIRIFVNLFYDVVLYIVIKT